MSSDIFKEIGEQIRKVNTDIAEAKELIKAMKEVGIDTTSQDLQIRNLEKQKAKWEVMLKNRGVSIG